nr:hypothetical protein [Pseudoxanthomonas sp.]
MALNSAAAVGNAGETERMIGYFARVDSVFPFSSTPTREVLAWYAAGLRGGITGSLDARARCLLAEGTRRVAGAVSQDIAAQLAATSGGVMYLGYLVTRDTLFSNAIRRLPGGAAIVHSDLDALEALTRGDTARAREIAATYTPPDSLRRARFAYAGLRAYGRAEVLAAVGNLDWAIQYLEALDPSRFNAQSLGEPGFAVYTRSFLTRASLYERNGEPAKAIAAYEEYLRRTTNGDTAVESLRRSARESIARLRDRSR